MTPTTFLALLTVPYALAVAITVSEDEYHPAIERLAAAYVAFYLGAFAMHLLFAP